MGLCFPCPGQSAPPSPDLEEKRAKLAEAAERRQKEAASRGILDVQSVEQKRKKKEKIEKQIATSGPPPEGGLRMYLGSTAPDWQTSPGLSQWRLQNSVVQI
ncbi:small VCP/p97-interacting protein isoform X2 [Equus asinus]|uniref:Small VCP interacting protein n=1 Tax=Equus asinus TaxID=9793 RepID=A0A9L0J8P1_EQUAS|nr:small VCP/p97-interacting protein [Equus asinus]